MAQRKKKGLTDEAAQAGARMRDLREFYGLRGNDITPENHTQVVNVESGANQLTGAELLMRYAAVFMVEPSDIRRYHQGEISLEDFAKRSQREPAAGGPPKRGRKKVHVFLSHNRRDSELADAIVEKLVRRGASLNESARGLDAARAFHRGDDLTPDELADVAWRMIAAAKGKSAGESLQQEEFGARGKRR